jgi:hypothetical protein
VTQSNKQIGLLTSPLNKIQDATEATAVILNRIAEVVLNGTSSKSGETTSDELKKQTTILTDIRSILREQNKVLASGAGAKGGAGGGMFSPMSAKDVGLTALMIVGVAGAIVGAAAIFTLVPVISIGQLLTVLAVAGIFALIAPTFVKIAEVLSGQKDLAGNGKGVDLSKPKSMFALAGATTLAMVGIAISIVLSGAIFSLMPVITGGQFLTALAVAVIMIPAAFAYSMILKASKDITKEQLMFAAAAIPLMALGIVGAAYAFMLLPKGDNLIAPDPIWVLKSALAIGLFAVGFYFIMKAIKGASPKELLYGALAIPLIALSLVAISVIFMMLPQGDNLMAPDPIWTLKSALAIGLFAVGFYFIMKAIKGASLRDIIFGAVAIPVMAIGIVLTSWIFMALPEGDNLKAPDPMWVLKAGFAMLIFAIPFYIISKAISGMSLKEMLFMAVAIPIIAFGVLATAWIFQGLAGIKFEAPEPEWSLKAALSVVLFGAMMYLSSKSIGKLSMGDMLKALLGVVVASFAVIAVALLFSMLPGTFIAPPMDWTLSAALAIGAFAIVISGVGIAVQALSPATLLLGALGIIVIAITIVAVGWILSLLAPAMPALKGVASGFVDIVMMPVNAIITAFARFKDEIGIENMIPLAIGVAALGGAWLIFSAAVAGGDVAGLLGSAAGAVGAIFNGISSLFGGSTPSPLDILRELATLGPQIQTLAAPLTAVGTGFALINKSANGVSKAFESVTKFVGDTDADDLTANAKSLSSIANSYAKISNASRTLNVKAIETTTNMFKALTDLAKNNGQSAMGVLADKLLVAVKELTGAAKNLEDSVAKQGDNTSAAADVVSGAFNNIKETVTGVKKDVGKMTADAKGVMDLQPLIDAITSLEERFDTFITVKIKPE